MFTNSMAIAVTPDFLVQAGAALVAWAFLACVGYVCTVWCFSYPMDWYRTARSTAIVIGSLGISLGFFYLLSFEWATITTTIIVPSILCVCAVHALLLLLKEFLAQRTELFIHKVRFYLALGFLYTTFIGAAVFVIHMNNAYISQCFSLSLHYFMYAAVLGIFGFSLCNHRHGDSY